MPDTQQRGERLNQRLKNLKTDQGQQTGFFEQMTSPYVRAAKDFNIGLGQMLGLPGMASSALRSVMGYEEESALPTGREIQQGMADLGMAYEPGEEPQAVFDYFMQNLGATAVPVGGFAAKGVRAAAPYLAELTAAGGGAVGGKLMQQTEWGQENPELARAIGELSGGLTALSPGVVGKLGKRFVSGGPPVLRTLKAPMRGQWARRRAIKSLAEQTDDPEAALRNLRGALKTTEEEGLTATQKTADRGIARLRKQVEEELTEQARFGQRQQSEAMQGLRAQAIEGKETGADVQTYLNNVLRRRADEAQEALEKARRAEKPEVYNRKARQKIEKVYEEARQQENEIWRNLPTEGRIEPNNLKQVYREELENITAGGDIREVDSFVRKKLGKIEGSGELTGGELLGAQKQAATPKELHQLYSRLGRRVRELSEQAGQTNKIRILNRLRGAILDDLDQTAVGPEYRKAINFSRQLNEKFTSGDLGKVLGFQRGQATPETLTLDELIGTGGQEARERINQVLRAAPQTEDDIKSFIRSRFAMQTVNDEIGRVNSQSGKRFLKQHRQLLDTFPDLKKELSDAVSKQKRVDQLTGVPDVQKMSPLAKQRAAASLYLNKEDPIDAIRQVIKEGRQKGNTTKYFRDLKKLVSKDSTGKAQKGLKNAIASELLEYSRRSGEQAEDIMTGQQFISGRRFLGRLDDLSKNLKESGLMSEKEINRLRRIGNAFKKVETEQTSKAAGQVVTDMPGQALDVFARVLGAQIGGKLGATSAGGSLQTAQIASSKMKRLIQSLTKDEARLALIQATRDDALMDDLLKNVNKMNTEKQQKFITQLINKIKGLGSHVKRRASQTSVPAAAVTPPLASTGRATEAETRRRNIKKRLQNLTPGQ